MYSSLLLEVLELRAIQMDDDLPVEQFNALVRIPSDLLDRFGPIRTLHPNSFNQFLLKTFSTG